jgi:hypothetical protein
MDLLDELKRGRESYRRQAWAAAYQLLLRADQAALLDVEDLELLATSAYLSGREDEFLRVLERAHQAHLHAGASVRAARCAFWIGLRLLLCGETGRATGWLARAQRLLEHCDCVEQGYLLLPVAEQHLAEGNGAAAYTTASSAAAIGERFSEADLIVRKRENGRQAREQHFHQTERPLQVRRYGLCL